MFARALVSRAAMAPARRAFSSSSPKAAAAATTKTVSEDPALAAKIAQLRSAGLIDTQKRSAAEMFEDAVQPSAQQLALRRQIEEQLVKEGLPAQLSPGRWRAWLARNPSISAQLQAVNGYKVEEDAPAAAAAAPLKAPVRVTVTGAAGAISYAGLLFRIASGALLGPDQPVILHLLELPHAQQALQGVVMELHDCAFPLLRGIVATADPVQGFDGCDVALLVGAKPRGPGMERADLLKENAAIFQVQGKALNKVANRDTLRVLVVGNPANTNALIAARNAPDIDPRRFTAMTRLDHNRGLAQLALKGEFPVDAIEKFCIWGNHSSTQFPDVSYALVNGQSVSSLAAFPDAWIKSTFIPVVQQRGAAIIKARGASSAASAGSAAIDHIRDWAHGTNGQWTSMAVYSNGEYGVDKGLYFSYPVICANGSYSIVNGLPQSAFAQERMAATLTELREEANAVAAFCK